MCLFNSNPSMPVATAAAQPPQQAAKEPDTPKKMAEERKARGFSYRGATFLTDGGAVPTADQLKRAQAAGGQVLGG